MAPSKLRDRTEYFGLFRDAGWERLSKRGLWQFFRKEVADGQVPQIYIDNRSKVGKYRRILALLGAMTAIISSQMAANSAVRHSTALTAAYSALLALLLYFILRIVLRINSLKRAAPQEG